MLHSAWCRILILIEVKIPDSSNEPPRPRVRTLPPGQTSTAQFDATYQAWDTTENFVEQWQGFRDHLHKLDEAMVRLREHDFWMQDFNKEAIQAAQGMQKLVEILDRKVEVLNSRVGALQLENMELRTVYMEDMLGSRLRRLREEAEHKTEEDKKVENE